MEIGRQVILVGYHTGADFPQSGVSVNNPDLYSCVSDGTVVYTYTTSTETSPDLGNQVQIRDNKTGRYYRYCHMLYGSIKVKVGDKVNTSTILGKMGNTGKSYGTHLHLELSNSQTWKCGTFSDPLKPLGIPNVRGTIVEYGGDRPLPTENLRQGEYGDYYGTEYNKSKALSEIQMEINAEYIYSALSNKGWTINAIAGILRKYAI